MTLQRNLQWRRSHVEESKTRIKDELDRIEKDAGPNGRLRHILDSLQNLANAGDSKSLIDRFVLSVSGLIHHWRFGGLSKRNIQDLAQIGESVLRVRNIVPGESQMSFLYGDLYNALSLIDHQSGEFYDSAWQLMMAHALSKPSSIAGEPYEAFSIATRLARLGAGKLCMQYLAKAIESGLPEREKGIAFAIMIRMLRLNLQYTEARTWIEKARKELKGDNAALEDIYFQDAVIASCESVDLYPIVKIVKKKSQHYNAANLLELRLWALSMPSDQWIETTVGAAQLRQRKGLSFAGLEVLAKIVERIDDSYDTQISLPYRLQRLANVNELSKVIAGVDKELLVVAAVVRALTRNKLQEFASLVMYRYESLSMAITSGTVKDALGIMRP